MKQMLMVLAGIVSLTLAAQAEEVAAKITFDGTPGTDSSGLTADMLTTAANWSDDQVPSSEKEYEITGAGYYSIGGGNTFNGKSLTLKCADPKNCVLTLSGANQSFTFANDGLIFNGGQFVGTSSKLAAQMNALNYTINGKVHFAASTYVYTYRTTNISTFTGPKISCAAGKTVTLTSPGSSSSVAYGLIAYHLRFLGDMSEFYGTLEVGQRSAQLAQVYLCTDNFAGKVLLTDSPNNGYYGSGTFGPCSTNASGVVTEDVGEVKVAELVAGTNGNLVVALGPTFSSADSGKITVTSQFSAKAWVNFFVKIPDYSMEERTVPVLVAPLGSKLAEVDFRPVIKYGSKTVSEYDDASPIFTTCVMTNETDGTESYCIRVPKYSTHTSTGEQYSDSSSLPEKFQKFWNWDYVADNRTTCGSDICYLSSVTVLNRGVAGFGGKRLVMMGARLITYDNTETIPEIDLRDKGYIYLRNGASRTFPGKIFVYGEGNYLESDYPYKPGGVVNDYLVDFSGTLAGDGAFELRGTTGTVVRISGDVSDFHGTLSMRTYSNAVVVNDSQHDVLKISDAAALGTPLAEAKAITNALTLANYSRLMVTETTTMPYTGRGFLVKEQAGVDVAAGKTFSYVSEMSLIGRCVKEGDGLFALGGTMIVTPAANRNKFEVSAGSIAALSAYAFDGAAISFASGTALVVDAGASDTELNEKGLVNTRWATPFVSSAEDGKIEVRFRATGATGVDDKAVAVCTVPTGSTFADPTKFKYLGRNRVGDLHFANFTATANGDGSTTVYANFTALPGSILLVR